VFFIHLKKIFNVQLIVFSAGFYFSPFPCNKYFLYKAFTWCISKLLSNR